MEKSSVNTLPSMSFCALLNKVVPVWNMSLSKCQNLYFYVNYPFLVDTGHYVSGFQTGPASTPTPHILFPTHQFTALQCPLMNWNRCDRWGSGHRTCAVLGVLAGPVWKPLPCDAPRVQTVWRCYRLRGGEAAHTPPIQPPQPHAGRSSPGCLSHPPRSLSRWASAPVEPSPPGLPARRLSRCLHSTPWSPSDYFPFKNTTLSLKHYWKSSCSH